MEQTNVIVQKMITFIEEHLEERSMLERVARHVGYSPWYVSVVFHDMTNLTLKNYVAGRRLSRATLDIRDTKDRILDIAVRYGYSSQEALTRAFKEQFGCTPAAYRRKPIPIHLKPCKVVLFPEMKKERIKHMDEKRLGTRVEHIPEHKYIGIWDDTVDNYWDFWQHHDCDTICGMIDSMDKMAHKIVTAHTAGWKWKDGKRTYFYGLGLSMDYDGVIPEGFEVITVPASDYIVFSYPAFNFLEENNCVMPAVEKLAWNFDLAELGYEWNEEVCQDYQRHNPEKLGYEILRPVKVKTQK